MKNSLKVIILFSVAISSSSKAASKIGPEQTTKAGLAAILSIDPRAYAQIAEAIINKREFSAPVAKKLLLLSSMRAPLGSERRKIMYKIVMERYDEKNPTDHKGK